MLTVVEGCLGKMVGTLLDRSEQIEQVFLLLKGVLFSYIIMGIIQPARKIKNIIYSNTTSIDPPPKTYFNAISNSYNNKIMNSD